jgi:hypothetical protein
MSPFIALVVMAAPLQTVVPKAGIVITRPVKFKAGTYLIEASDETGKGGAIAIRGNGLTVDFSGVVLRGTPETAEPDARKGTAVYVEGRNITIKNLRAHGYKIGLIARNSPGLKVLDSDLSYNWKQHLQSTLDREDLSDWMSFHQNEKDEWLRYGAGIYLRDCDNFEVRGTTIRGGQCGLMITGCDKGLVWNNDFSFLSAIGLGMYRSSENRIMHNKIDWCVRGFSYGKYNRGQDSAGILIYEQSNKNVFAYNSVTHGGDGFFLWAGQTSMDTGEGGCNDNLLYGNDFSHAPTNGIEATFSRNTFANNLVMECWHGIWGGYSYNSKVVGNVFAYNAEAIAWEHGQENEVRSNHFYRDNQGLVIWSNPTQDPNWGYAKKRDTRSRDWLISKNLFEDEFAQSVNVRRSTKVSVDENLFKHCGSPLINLGELTTGFTADAKNMADSQQFEALSRTTGPAPQSFTYDLRDTNSAPKPAASSLNPGYTTQADYLGRFDVRYRPGDSWKEGRPTWNPFLEAVGGSGPASFERSIREGIFASVLPHRVLPLKNGIDPFLPKGALRGWRYMIVDEWGPYDFKRPLLWQREVVARASSTAIDTSGKATPPHQTTTSRFEILGPKGNWRLVSAKGARLNKERGAVPDMVEVTLDEGKAQNIDISLEYTGEETVDYRGIVTPKGKPVRFGYSQFFAPIDWNVRWYSWDKDSVSSPRDKMPPAGQVLNRTQLRTPLKEERTDRIDYAWGGSPGGRVPADYFITLADGSFTIDPGEYDLSVTTDDGVRVWVDDQLVIDEWHWQGPTLYTKTLKLGGQHRIRVEHYEIDGYAALKVELKPRRK